MRGEQEKTTFRVVENCSTTRISTGASVPVGSSIFAGTPVSR
jgi:hypothetical protein